MISNSTTVACLVVLVGGLVVACSSSSSSGSSSGSASSAYKTCPSPSESSCSQAERDTYDACVMNACDAPLRECFGAGYRSGDFSGGTCSAWMTCSQKCACDDTKCEQACGQVSDACIACIGKTSSCSTSSACKAPACARGEVDAGLKPVDGSDQACADLQACCNRLTDPTDKDSCQQSHDQNPSMCSTFLSTYRVDGLCP